MIVIVTNSLIITNLPPPLAAVASPGVPGAEPPPDPGLLLLHLGVEALEEVLLLLEVGGHTSLAAHREWSFGHGD